MASNNCSGPFEQARFDHRRRDADVRCAFALAVVDRAHAVADFEADVPHEGEEAFEIALPRRRFALRQQNHDVDIGAEIELAAAVTADRDQCDFAGVFADVQRPRAFQQRVDESRAIAHQALDRLVVEEALLEAIVALGQRGAKGGDVMAFAWPASAAT